MLVYCDSNMRHVNRLCGQQSDMLVVQLDVHLLYTSPLSVQIFPINVPLFLNYLTILLLRPWCNYPIYSTICIIH
jgi:hypothetical protein